MKVSQPLTSSMKEKINKKTKCLCLRKFHSLPLTTFYINGRTIFQNSEREGGRGWRARERERDREREKERHSIIHGFSFGVFCGIAIHQGKSRQNKNGI